MKNKEALTTFINLHKREKEQLTLKWLTDLIKSQHLTIADVIDILNSVDATFSKADKLNALLINGTVTASAISRILGYGYAKSMNYINSLLKRNIIVKIDNCYKIIDKENFKAFSKDFLGE